MANPTVSYVFVNGNVADASQVNQNFADLIAALTDGTKSLNIDAITAAGAAVFNGNTTLGNAAGDTITLNGTFAGTGGVVSETAPGVLPAATSSLSDATSTRFGLKQYLHGTTYNNSAGPTITLTNGGGTLTTALGSLFIPYQLQDGTWRCRFEIAATLSEAVRTIVELTINGLTFKNTSGFIHAITGYFGSTAQGVRARAGIGSSTVVLEILNGVTHTVVACSGDVALESKPTWAY